MFDVAFRSPSLVWFLRISQNDAFPSICKDAMEKVRDMRFILTGYFRCHFYIRRWMLGHMIHYIARREGEGLWVDVVGGGEDKGGRAYFRCPRCS